MSTELPPKSARLEARISVEQKSLIEQAAAYEGRTVSDFVVQTVQQAAKSVIEQYESIRLSRSQSRAFVDVFLNPPDPNDALRQAAAEHHRDVSSQ